MSNTNIRLIARLDIKGANLIKGIHLEGLRVMGDPQVFATQYYQEGADELIYIDSVASLYQRNNLHDIVRRTVENIFIPVTAGGGIRSVEDVRQLLRAGADKIAINTAAIHHPQLITEVSRTFGSQCMVLSIQAKQIGKERWEAYTDGGREHSGKDVVEWAKTAEKLGAGEILLTSIDKEGTRTGFDIELVKAVATSVSIPVIASGGMGNTEHLLNVIKQGAADAVAMASVLHYKNCAFPMIRQAALAENIQVRHLV